MNNNQNEKKTSAGVIIATVIVVLAFVAVIVIFVSLFLSKTLGINFSKPKETETTAEIQSESETGFESETEKAAEIKPITKFTTAKVPTSDINKGLLILVNSEHAFNFDGSESYITLYGNKSNNYMISGSGLKAAPQAIEALNLMLNSFYGETSLSNVLVKAAYRTFDEQAAIYDNCAETYGDDAVKYVSLPGCSDHNIGYAFDLGVYSEDGAIYSLDCNDKYNKIIEMCGDYGFILRFPTSKASVTGISTDPFHFRYVGIPHSAAMKQLNLCLEEYLEYVKSYLFSGEHLQVTVGEKNYEIYYYRADTEKEEQEIPIPENREYTVSGNNVDGFIISFVSE